MAQLITIVNEKDEVVDSKERDTIDYARDIYRVSALWVTNGKGEVLLAQRSTDKKYSPGLWGPAVSGTVEVGEDYETNIYKEAGEEIGLFNATFELGPKHRKKEPETYRNYFAQWFTYQTDQPESYFKPRRGEVDAVKWVAPSMLKEEFSREPGRFVPSMQKIIETFIDSKND